MENIIRKGGKTCFGNHEYTPEELKGLIEFVDHRIKEAGIHKTHPITQKQLDQLKNMTEESNKEIQKIRESYIRLEEGGKLSNEKIDGLKEGVRSVNSKLDKLNEVFAEKKTEERVEDLKSDVKNLNKYIWIGIGFLTFAELILVPIILYIILKD
jgi:predicted nuclease with TOPRIM domain